MHSYPWGYVWLSGLLAMLHAPARVQGSLLRHPAVSANGTHCCAGTRGYSHGGAGSTAGAQPTPASGLTRTTLQTTSTTRPPGRLCRCAWWYRHLLLDMRHACPELCWSLPFYDMPNIFAHCQSRHRFMAWCGQSSCTSVYLPQRAHQPLRTSAPAPVLSVRKQGRSAWAGAPLDGGLAGVSPRAKAGAYDGGPPWEVAHPGGPGILDAGKDRKSNAEITPLEVTKEQQPHPLPSSVPAARQPQSGPQHAWKNGFSELYLHWADKCVCLGHTELTFCLAACRALQYRKRACKRAQSGVSTDACLSARRACCARWTPRSASTRWAAWTTTSLR